MLGLFFAMNFDLRYTEKRFVSYPVMLVIFYPDDLEIK